jgi:hypothetical protein
MSRREEVCANVLHVAQTSHPLTGRYVAIRTSAQIVVVSCHQLPPMACQISNAVFTFNPCRTIDEDFSDDIMTLCMLVRARARGSGYIHEGSDHSFLAHCLAALQMQCLMQWYLKPALKFDLS